MQSNVPPQIFFGHVDRLRQTLSSKFASDMDSVILITGKGASTNEKTSAFVSWFMAGYKLADTILAFTQKLVIIYASDRKIAFLANLKDHVLAQKYGLVFIPKNDDMKTGFKKMWVDLHAGITRPKVGTAVGESRNGQISEEFDKFLQGQSYEEVEGLPLFNQCFMAKDSEEVENMKRSSKVTCYFFAKFIKEVQQVIDSGKATKHNDLANNIQETIENESELKKCTIKLSAHKITKEYIEAGLVCTVQSTGSFSSKLFAEPNDKQLKPQCIVLGLGTVYRGYNTYMGRTLLINPTEEQKGVYKKVETLLRVIIQNLRVGVKLCDVYRKAKQFVTDNLPGVEIPKNFGFGMGIFMCENNLLINESNERLISSNYVFLINCTFTDIKYDSKKELKTFAIQLVDNVLVTEAGQEVLTMEVSKTLAEISYELEDEEVSKKKDSRPKPSASSNIVTGSRRRVQDNTKQKLKSQKERNEHQTVLKQKKLAELKQRMHDNFNGDFKKERTIECAKIDCYRSREELPKDMKKNLIYIDNKNNAILLPISGTHVPFHICILKSVVKNDEGKHASLRFNFHLPNTIATINFPKYKEPTVFVKEIVFRSQQVARITELQKQVKNLQKKVRLEASEKHAKEDIVEQEKLNLNKGKRPVLPDLYARPGIGQKKVKGNLECHLNGFRYSTPKGEHIEVAFSNIKFAFFQPCEKEIIAAVHFRLHESIMVSKKKSSDIQFYSEGATVTDDVVGRGRGEDSDDEERQKQAKRRIDKNFLAWIRACEDYTHKSFEFEIPRREQGFYGATFRSSVLLQPTNSCLINVTEPHPFLFCIQQIEVACFERMYGNIRYFDLTLIHKDYEQNTRISAISIKDVERVKDWLDTNGIIFYDSKTSMNWGKFLAIIRADFKKFVEDGGWTAWDSADEDDEIEQEDGDSQFSASSKSDDSDDSEESESDFEEEDGSGSSEEESDQDLSEEGLEWDELEERAEREDRERLKKEIEKHKDGDVRPAKRK